MQLLTANQKGDRLYSIFKSARQLCIIIAKCKYYFIQALEVYINIFYADYS